MVNCPHCGKEFESDSGGFKNHTRSCGNRPSDEELLSDYETLTMAQMADKYEVSRHSVSRWLRSARAGGQHRRNGEADDLEIDPGIAPAYEKTDKLIKRAHPRQLIIARGPCGFCQLEEQCKSLMLSIGWVLCEAPDREQKERWAAEGIDPRRIVKALGIAELVENASCTNS